MFRIKFCLSLQSHWNCRNRSIAICFKTNIFPKIENSTSKYMCTNNDQSEVHSNKIFREIYRFNGIKVGYILQKAKWYQTLGTVTAIPTCALLHFTGIIGVGYVTGAAISGFVISIHLYGIAQIFHKAIGFMYISEDETTLKVSYLDFWGNRIDEEYPVEDVMCFSDIPHAPMDNIYKSVKFFSDKKVLKLYSTFAKITDSDSFNKIFGKDQ